MVLCADISQQRRAAEATEKEQQLLRQFFDLQEHDRRWAADEIHESLAQHLSAAMLHLQGFRETLAQTPQRAWQMFDTAMHLLCQSVNGTRHLISAATPDSR